MRISAFLKKGCIMLPVLTLIACGGGGGGGNGAVANISLSGSSYDFGDIALGSNSEKTITITNTTYGSLNFGTISTSGPPFSISSDTCSGHTWYKDGTCSLTVRFTPTTKGTSTGSLSISSNDPDQSTATVALSGKGTVPSISLSEASYDFGTIVLGNNSTKPITVTNTGDAPLIFGTISTSGAPFSISSDTCSKKTVAANGTCSLTVQFTPTSEGTFPGSISIPSNDPGVSTATVALNGKGKAEPNISLSESIYDFGGVILNNAGNKTFVITNTGTAPLIFGTISSSGAPFSISSDTCSGNTVAAKGTCSLTAQFLPTTQGSFSGTLSIPSNDPDLNTATVDLSGEGYGLNVWINNILVDSSCNISFDVTVTDPASSTIIELDPSQFTVKLGGVDISSASTIKQIEIDSPVSAILAIDWSGSVTKVIGNIQPGANNFLNQLINDADEAAVMKFNAQTGLIPVPIPYFYKTTDPLFSSLSTYIDIDAFGDVNGTLLYDAVYASIERATHGSNSKRAVVVLSDGADNGSVKTLTDVTDYAVTEKVPVFSIFYYDLSYNNGTWLGSYETLKTLAEETGGQAFSGLTTDLNEVYKQIANTLSSKYSITYTSSSCSSGTVILEVDAEYNGLQGHATADVVFP
jgi:VWFA-related protein